jgi:ornithine--oxo-acid transaminase
MTLAKGLGAGMPIGAVLATDKVASAFSPGDHGSTFGGNPLGCAVAREALRVLADERLIERSAQLGEYLVQSLLRIESPHIKQIRGKGLWIGIVLKPEAGGARRFCEALMARGMLCKETHWNVIRLAPPLIITEEEIDWAIERLT